MNKNKIVEFFKKETVLCISFIAALISCFFYPPSAKYFEYFNLPVLSMLFCLMAVIAGFNSVGVFSIISNVVINKSKNINTVSLILILLSFFVSMLVTNDVALITFVPLAISILSEYGEDRLIFTIVMQTISANLGSMATPMGNPQNLFLYSYYSMSINEFLNIVLPITIISFFLILFFIILKNNSNKTIDYKIDNNKSKNIFGIIKYVIVFTICVLSVVHIIDYKVCLVITILSLLIGDIKLFKKIDFMLLLTFIFFFIFSGNLSNIACVKEFMNKIISGNEFLVSVLLSQIISNVPCAVMIAPFTDNVHAILSGVNIGGLGTPVASLASLISYKLYQQHGGAKPGKYMIKFGIYNILFLGVLICIFYLMQKFKI